MLCLSNVLPVLHRSWSDCVENLRQRHDRDRTENRQNAATVDSCFELVGSRQHGVAQQKVEQPTGGQLSTKCRWFWFRMGPNSEVCPRRSAWPQTMNKASEISCRCRGKLVKKDRTATLSIYMVTWSAEQAIFLRFSGEREQARGERGVRVTRDRRGTAGFHSLNCIMVDVKVGYEQSLIGWTQFSSIHVLVNVIWKQRYSACPKLAWCKIIKLRENFIYT